MYTITRHILLIIITVVVKAGFSQQTLPFRNAELPLETRITDLISRMTVEEKISQLHFDAKEIPRLGIKHWNYWGEALHGVARFHEATVFPQVIGLGSTWNPDLIEQMAFATGLEARVFNNQFGKGLTYFSPTINLARDPRWGRTEEAYSEDPYLTGRMGVAFVNGLQGAGKNDYMLAAATVKHFVADNSEFHRSVASSYVDMRDLREYYFPAFEMAVKEANVISVMPTYRGLNGIPNCANNWLLDKVLRQEWGFSGYTVSDCWAIHDIVKRQFYVTENEKAVQISLLAGLDLNCGDYYIQFLQSTLDKGYISEDDIDLALYRVLESRFRLGDFDPDHLVPWKSVSEDVLNSSDHQQLALDTALESIVLMKNDNDFLPLEKDRYKSIAVIGIKAEEPEYGGYTGYPNQAVTILQGIQYKTGAAQNGFETIKAERFYQGSYIQKIINYSSFENQNVNLAGRTHPLMIKNNDWIMFKDVDLGNGATGITLDAANQQAGGLIEIRLGSLDAEVIGTLKVTDTGDWSSLKNFTSDLKRSSGIHDVYLTFKGEGEHLFNLTAFKFLPARRNYRLTPTDTKVTYAQGSDVIVEDRTGFEAALKAAGESELVVFVYGTDLTVANEGQDPADINVPAIQRELLKKVYEVNPNVVLVLAVGFPLVIDWEKENIPAIVGAWFGGQAQGTAVADVLFGDYNPGGKLPMTWYRSEYQLPDFSDYHIRKNNRTYLYFQGEPLFPFGYGLSYTSFGYGDIKLDQPSYKDTDDIEISFELKNTGSKAGSEVVQVYFNQLNASVKTPLKKLIRFDRVWLEPGESKTIAFSIPVKEMGFWDIKNNDFIVESGQFNLMVGSSSADIRQTASIKVFGKKYEQGIIRVNAGGDYYVDADGTEWMPDYGFDFGRYAYTYQGIAKAKDPVVFQTKRTRCDESTVQKVEYPNADYLYQWHLNTCKNTGLFYNYEVLNGAYDVNLYFSEIVYEQPGKRVFDIEIEDKRVVENLDIYREAGSNTAHKVEFKNIRVHDGYLTIRFLDVVGLPAVSGIEIIPVKN